MGGKQIIAEIAPIDGTDEKDASYKYHPYKIRGFVRASKSGKALNITLKESDGNLHLITIAKLDIIDAFKNGTQCCAIEYQISDEEKKEMKENGN